MYTLIRVQKYGNNFIGKRKGRFFHFHTVSPINQIHIIDIQTNNKNLNCFFTFQLLKRNGNLVESNSYNSTLTYELWLTPDEPMLIRDCHIIGYTAARTQHISVALWTSLSCPCIGRSACSRGRCCGYLHPVSSAAYFVGVCWCRVWRMVPHCRQGQPRASGLCHSRRIVGTSSSSPGAAACHPVPSSLSLHCTVPLAATGVPIRRMDSCGKCASPRSA